MYVTMADQDMTISSKANRLNRISGPANLFINLFFILCACVCVAPILLVVAISLTNEMDILLYGYSFIPREFSAKSYEYVMKAGEIIWRAYGISIFVTVVGTGLSLLVICMYAYPLSRQSFKYKSQFAFLAYFTMIFGGGLVPW